MNNKQIAASIMQDYQGGKYAILAGGLIEFYIDSLVVRCPNNSTGVEHVVRKFKRGLPRQGRTFVNPGPRVARKKFSLEAFDSFWGEGEYENAREYMRLFPRDEWHPKAAAVVAA